MAQEAQGAPGNEELPDIPGYRIDSHLGSGGIGSLRATRLHSKPTSSLNSHHNHPVTDMGEK
jgi:hypothetical protein